MRVPRCATHRRLRSPQESPRAMRRWYEELLWTRSLLVPPAAANDETAGRPANRDDDGLTRSARYRDAARSGRDRGDGECRERRLAHDRRNRCYTGARVRLRERTGVAGLRDVDSLKEHAADATDCDRGRYGYDRRAAGRRSRR